MEENYASFIIAKKPNLILTYKVGDFKDISRGMFCKLTIRKQAYIAILIKFISKPSDSINYISIEGVLKDIKPLPEPVLALLNWASDYYLYPVSFFASLLAPGPIWNLSKLEGREKLVDKIQASKAKLNTFKKALNPLSEEQKIIYQKILEDKDSQAFLLEGVTGSGKTEIYLHLTESMLSQGRNVLVIIPEISLTSQLYKRFHEVFSDTVVFINSSLSTKVYEENWLKANHNRCRIVIGVRTSVFNTINNLGLIIVDEEHDSSLKSESVPFFQARDLAVVRARLENALCVLGSATPSIDSIHNSHLGRFKRFFLEKRFHENIPDVHFVNQNNTKPQKKNKKRVFHGQFLSDELLERIKENFLQDNLTMIIINRRGYVNYLLCQDCESPLKCPNCDVSTTIHNKMTLEICHYCGFNTKLRQSCEKCHSKNFTKIGVGTQSIIQELDEKLPELKTLRLDRDVLTSSTRLNKILNNFKNKESYCLVGTQMISKGHDFPMVTLVVLINLEELLFFPDFRSYERAYQLLVQSVGRAGRSKLKSDVVIYSRLNLEDNQIVSFALNNGRNSFYNFISTGREIAKLPPFSRLILIEVACSNKDKSMIYSKEILSYLSLYWKKIQIGDSLLRVAGPNPAMIEQIDKKYRTQISLFLNKSLHPKKLFPGDFFDELKDKKILPYFKIIVDPISLL